MNIVSLKFSPIFCPKLGKDQKKGPCRNFACYSMLIMLSWRPKGGAMAQCPSPLNTLLIILRFKEILLEIGFIEEMRTTEVIIKEVSLTLFNNYSPCLRKYNLNED